MFEKHKMSIILFLILVLNSCDSIEERQSLVLVENNFAKSCIVMPENTVELQRIAVNDFVRTVEQATEVSIPVLSEKDADSVSNDVVKIFIGPTQKTAELGLDGEDLSREEFRIKTIENGVVILARDLVPEENVPNIWNQQASENSRVTQWALGYLLDRYLGVRWIWPGDLGTHIPKTDNFTLPKMDVRVQQPLLRRCFNVISENDKNLLWLNYHHFAGQRKDYHFQHSFRKHSDNGDWWAMYHEAHPDYLAQNPAGKPELFRGKKGRYKLCVSNPDVAKTLIQGWKDAGAPDFWDVSPNDGNGFCTCDNCRALDLKYGQVTYTKQEIWNRPDHVGLTDRYVWFWNKLIKEMRQTNPSATIGVFIYGAFKIPPKTQCLAPGIVGEIVHGFDFEYWKSWTAAGVTELGLRPNWLYMGASAPHLPLSEFGTYMEKARENGMVLIDLDCFHEYWATQGPNYYLFARMVGRPDLNHTEVLEEYVSAFGEASQEIREYLDYWEKYHQKVMYNIPAGGSIWRDTEGIYGTVSKEKFVGLMGVLKGHWKTLPYVYTLQVRDRAKEILNLASAKVSDDIYLRRIDFLRDGLVGLEHAIAYMSADEAHQEVAIKSWMKFNQEMVEKHGYWSSKDVFFVKYWGLYGKEMDTEGM